MEKTKYSSFKIGKLTKGCKLCMQGKKSVLLVTGICPENCFYCPLSEQKKNIDVIYINEIPLNKINNSKMSNIDENIKKSYDEIKKEIILCKSKGIGITGGDPLAKLERTCKFISLLKKDFGMEFHIHLYTPFKLVSKENIKKLFLAGLDEIRFQAFLNESNEWNKIEIATKFKWNIGIEIPLFPDKLNETKKLIDYFKNKVNFFNLNELEISHTNEDEMSKKGYHIKINSPSSVEQSYEKGLEILKYYENEKINIHFCTASLKDGYQLKNRMLLRAESIAKDYDDITKEGLLKRGVVYLKSLYPSINYNKKLKEIKKVKERNEFYIKKLKEIKNIIDIKTNFNKSYIDGEKLCLYVNVNQIPLIKKINLKNIKYGWIELYPTYDEFITEIEILN